jgi:hypothetical protein
LYTFGIIFNGKQLFCFKPLDRDPPDGYPQWQVYISAKDEYGGPSSLSETTEVIIDLTDINDNAPFLSMVSILHAIFLVEFRYKKKIKSVNIIMTSASISSIHIL